jgi:hypothetical protein
MAAVPTDFSLLNTWTWYRFRYQEGNSLQFAEVSCFWTPVDTHVYN